MEDIIQRIRDLMTYKGLNISDTAKLVGITQPNLSSILAGKRPIGDNVLNKFVLAFNVNKKWLLSGDGEMFAYQRERAFCTEAERFKMIRQSLELTIPEIAEILGVAIPVIEDIENNTTPVNNLIKQKMKATFDINPLYIAGNAEKVYVSSGGFIQARKLAQDFKNDKSRMYGYNVFNDESPKSESADADVITFKTILEKRIREAYNYGNQNKPIYKRVVEIVKYSGLSNEDFAKQANLYVDKFQSQIKGETLFDLDTITLIAKSFKNISSEWLLIGEEPMFKENHNTDKALSEAMVETRPRIPYTAAAGRLSEALEGVTKDQCVMVPVVRSFPEYDFSIVVNGDSMSPEYKSGDEIACKRINDSRFIQWGRAHVLDTTQGIVIKCLYDDGDSIRCVSLNSLYPPFSIPKDGVYSISLVVGMLRL